MRIFLLLLLGFPLLEMGLLVWLGSKFGLWVLLWLIATTVLGVMMLRHYGVSALLPVWGMMRQGQISLYQLLWPIRFVIAGVLFLIPGVLTDIAAILLLLPFGGRRCKHHHNRLTVNRLYAAASQRVNCRRTYDHRWRISTCG